VPTQTTSLARPQATESCTRRPTTRALSRGCSTLTAQGDRPCSGREAALQSAPTETLASAGERRRAPRTPSRFCFRVNWAVCRRALPGLSSSAGESSGVRGVSGAGTPGGHACSGPSPSINQCWWAFARVPVPLLAALVVLDHPPSAFIFDESGGGQGSERGSKVEDLDGDEGVGTGSS
jgi:hypothetical protein